jgi:hypothetical protein
MSVPVRTEKLKGLLEQTFGSAENPWISKPKMEKAGFRVMQGEGDLLESVRLGCLSRDWANEVRGKPVDGFECLLRNMDTTQKKRVLIHGMVDAERRKYRIFTDPEINELIGILRYPVENPRDRPKFRTDRLKRLLADSFGSDVNPWISGIEVEKAVFDVAKRDGTPLVSLQMTYERRGQLNKERGSPIEGFECLLQNMDKTDAKMALVHGAIDSRQREYHIFTDEGVDELIGLLRFPESWMDRPRGLDLLKPPTEVSGR